MEVWYVFFFILITSSSYSTIFQCAFQIFENDVEIQGNIQVHGNVNKLKPDQLVEDYLLQAKSAANLLNKQASLLEQSTLRSKNSFRPAKQLLYLEEDDTLGIELPGVYNVKSTVIESTTLLDVYAKASGELCGLRNDCLCRRQYAVKMENSSMGYYVTIDEVIISDLFFKFYESNRLFGLYVFTTSVSSSERCTRQSNEPEITKIFWMAIEDGVEKRIGNPVLESIGFVADAQAFLVNGI